jgi:hypothetical protein
MGFEKLTADSGEVIRLDQWPDLRQMLEESSSDEGEESRELDSDGDTQMGGNDTPGLMEDSGSETPDELDEEVR